MTIQELVNLVKRSLEQAEYCFFITLGADGSPNTRLVQHFKPEDDSLTLWFGTSPRSRKVHEIQQDPRVTIAFYDDKDIAYVTLRGTAEVVDDLALRQRYWMEGWRIFFPGGPDGSDYVLLRFVPQQVELMNFTKQITPPPYGLAHVDLQRENDRWVVTGGLS